MKRFICTFLALVLLPVFAVADDFLDFFNVCAKSMYGIDDIKFASDAGIFKAYTSTYYDLQYEPDCITLYGTKDHIVDLIAAGCCALRCFDNSGNMIDQYGRLLHAYFLARSADDKTEKRATTDSGILVYVLIENSLVTIRLVK